MRAFSLFGAARWPGESEHLSKHDGRLHPGKLFWSEGGCAVGVMLRELFPGYPARRGLIGRLRPPKESIADEHPQLARSLPRLTHIEIWFDNTIEICRERDASRTVAEWAQAVGRWLAGCLYAELDRRSRVAAEPLAACGRTAIQGWTASHEAPCFTR